MRSPAVYFAQPTNGGPIKLGSTDNLRSRRQSLGSWVVNGIEIITSMPGSLADEGFLLEALKPWRVQGEWLRSCIPIWQFMADVDRSGRPSWMPAELEGEPVLRYGSYNRGPLEEEIKRLTIGLGRKSPRYLGGPSVYGRLLFARSFRDGTLPPWIFDAHSAQAAASEAAE